MNELTAFVFGQAKQHILFFIIGHNMYLLVRANNVNKVSV